MNDHREKRESSSNKGGQRTREDQDQINTARSRGRIDEKSLGLLAKSSIK